MAMTMAMTEIMIAAILRPSLVAIGNYYSLPSF